MNPWKADERSDESTYAYAREEPKHSSGCCYCRGHKMNIKVTPSAHKERKKVRQRAICVQNKQTKIGYQGGECVRISRPPPLICNHDYDALTGARIKLCCICFRRDEALSALAVPLPTRLSRRLCACLTPLQEQFVLLSSRFLFTERPGR